MALFKVSANPKGGTCFQFIQAESEDDAIQKAKDNPNGWKSPVLKNGFDDWNIRAYEKQPRR